jgi:hypothetical protein
LPSAVSAALRLWPVIFLFRLMSPLPWGHSGEMVEPGLRNDAI